MTHPASGHLFLCPGGLGVIVSKALPVPICRRQPEAPSPTWGCALARPCAPPLPDWLCGRSVPFLGPWPGLLGSLGLGSPWCAVLSPSAAPLHLGLAPISHLWVPIHGGLRGPELHLGAAW